MTNQDETSVGKTFTHKVLQTDFPWGDYQVEEELLNQFGIELIPLGSIEPKVITKAAKDVDGILTCWAPVSAKTLKAAEKCVVVSRLGIGLDNIDVQEASKLGIAVTNIPDYCLKEVAEHTIALLFSLARKTAYYHWEVKNQRYDLNAGPPLKRIEGQTLGLIGVGNIGRVVAQKARALGLNVIAVRKNHSESIDHVELVSLDELLQRSDYVSLHAPFNSETKQLLSAEQFAVMKNSAYLINTSRGGLVSEEDLYQAIQSGEIAGAALDVQATEPPDVSQPLFQDPRVIVTPHCAFLSEESLLDLRTRAVRQAIRAIQSHRPENLVNPEVWE